MVVLQISQTSLGKLVGTIGRRRLPGMSRDSEQRRCCYGVCEVHKIGGGGMTRCALGDDGMGDDRLCIETAIEERCGLYMIRERMDGRSTRCSVPG